ncbi:MAG TPA: hypothetical protein VG347_08755 [Verrucomicrobiae bacterium]|nr:hypothetical protein [Verrucomicrobiae bacterium]
MRSLLARTTLLLVPAGFIPPLIVPARLVPPLVIATLILPAGLITSRFVPALVTLRRRLHLPWRLDATQCAAQFIDLAFIGQLLTLGQFYEFQNLIQLVDRVLERLRDLRRMQNRFMDGRARCRPEINRLHPLFGALRFRAALWETVALLRFMLLLGMRRMTRRFPFWRRRMLPGRFRSVRFFRFRLRFRGGKISRFLGMRLAKTPGVFRLHILASFGVLSNLSRLTGRRARLLFINGIFSRCGRFFSRRTRSAAAPTATTAATATIGGTSRRCGRLQVGIFVWHRFSVRMTVRRAKSKAN